jgi:hypothetical protein
MMSMTVATIYANPKPPYDYRRQSLQQLLKGLEELNLANVSTLPKRFVMPRFSVEDLRTILAHRKVKVLMDLVYDELMPKAKPAHFCEQCGKPVPESPDHEGHEGPAMRFDTEICEKRWYAARGRRNRRAPKPPLVCRQCGREMVRVKRTGRPPRYCARCRPDELAQAGAREYKEAS